VYGDLLDAADDLVAAATEHQLTAGPTEATGQKTAESASEPVQQTLAGLSSAP
jgi:hypothetical protein